MRVKALHLKILINVQGILCTSSLYSVVNKPVDEARREYNIQWKIIQSIITETIDSVKWYGSSGYCSTQLLL